MRGELVAVDLETTGFDPVADEIIEIAAVRFSEGKILEEFSTFVNPGRRIPPQITQLTGITDSDVLSAPSIHNALPLLRSFVGSSTWIAHNAGFDGGFLNQRGALVSNNRIDTYELAAILLPGAPRYNLMSLTALLGADIGSAHRALFDARATAHVYWKLWEKALTLPAALLNEIVELGKDLRWDGKTFFQAALQEAPPGSGDSYALPFTPDNGDRRVLRRKDTADFQPVHIRSIQDVLGIGGRLSQQIAHYEERRGQLQMADEVASAFNNASQLMIEAGTGTGKSIAYLVPAALWAAQNQDRVVISTNTINLQEQLILKDIPSVQDALDSPLHAALMKGRANYLCPRRLDAARRRKPSSADELRTLGKILVWLNESSSGDRGELTLRGEENAAWLRLSADDEGCTTETCRALMDGSCPFYKARRLAEAAHLVVVNHALLISDALADNRVLPEYDHLIVDEAHHLEDAITSGLSFRLDERTLRSRAAELGSERRGLLGAFLAGIRRAAVPDKDIIRLETYLTDVGAVIGAMDMHIHRFFTDLRALAASLTRGRSDYTVHLRILDDVRRKHEFARVQDSWSTLQEFLVVISEALHQLNSALERFAVQDQPELENLSTSISAADRFFLSVSSQVQAFVNEPSANVVYWLSSGQNEDTLSLNTAPLHVGEMTRQFLWSSKSTVILTSATLQTNGSFEFLQHRIDAEHMRAIEVESPFDYRESTLVFVPDDIPDPGDKHRYQQAVERGIIELAAALNGRVLALFTSYAQLRETAQAIAPRLALGNIVVYDQSDGSSRQALLEGFQSAERAVLLGTRSFWEGVDIAGEALSALVIVRLPFAVPTDPVFAARSETYADHFNAYALPDAILRFRQGFGRLIRRKSDRGIVAILDSRVRTKAYGRAFLDALPDCTTISAPLSQLPHHAASWLERSKS